jgi:AcrR family transcriptional regulator
VSEPTTRQERIKQRSAERRERSRQRTRQAILEAAVKLFEREGYEGFSLRQVAEAIGYTPTTIYLYFEDKDDLLFAVCQQGFAEFTQALERTYRQHADPRERLRALAWSYLEFGLSHPLHYQTMFMRRSEWMLRATPPAEEKPEESKPDSYTVFMNAVIEAMKAGKLRMGDPVETTNLLWSGVHGIVSLALSMKGVVPRWDEASVRRLMEHYLEMTDRGLGP